MQALSEREILLERRVESQDIESLWHELSLAQKFAASSLTQFGYELQFIRQSQQENLAVLNCDGHIATISNEGEIDASPNIQLRK